MMVLSEIIHTLTEYQPLRSASISVGLLHKFNFSVEPPAPPPLPSLCKPFFDLPREIRDEIYRHYFISKCYWFPPGSSHQTTDLPTIWHPNREPDHLFVPGPTDEAILQVSKAVRTEAAAMLLSTAVFRFQMWLGGCGCSVGFSPFSSRHDNNNNMLERVMRVEIILDLREYWERTTREDEASESEDAVLREPAAHCVNRLFQPLLAAFAGLNVRRKEFGVRFQSCYVGHVAMRETYVYKALRFMTGFENVVVELECPAKSFEESEHVDGRAIDEWVKDEFCGFEDCGEYWEAVGRDMKHQLRPTLGPGGATYNGDAYKDGERYCRCVEFHPLRYRDLLLRQNATESSRLNTSDEIEELV